VQRIERGLLRCRNTRQDRLGGHARSSAGRRPQPPPAGARFELRRISLDDVDVEPFLMVGSNKKVTMPIMRYRQVTQR
jgi:hypothetical protein